MTGQRVLPGLGLSAYWTKGTGNWDTQHDPDTRMLSALVQCHAKSRTALPGSPVNGDVYIVPAAAGTNPNQIVIRDNGAWVYYVQQEGWWVWVEDEDNYVYWSGAAWVPFVPGTVLPSITGNAGKILKVNSGATGLEWADESGGGDALADYTASHVLTLDDKNIIVTMASATALDLTVPPNADEAFTLGSVITAIQKGAGQVTIVPGSGVTVNVNDGFVRASAGQWAVFSLIKIDTNVWVLTGALEAV